MSHTTHFVNCPHCAAILEVVNPRPDTKPRKVVAATGGSMFADENVEIKCQNCEFWIRIQWHY